MTNEETLKKAINKAVKSGWASQTEKYDAVNDLDDMFYKDESNNIIFSFIFSHEFAEAFWGEEFTEKESGEVYAIYNKDCFQLADSPKPKSRWQFHLQQLVLFEDPIEYLAKFL